MATYNNSYSLPRQPISSSPMSVVDIFFPGFTYISTALQQLQAGNSNGYAPILCVCGIVVFLGKYTYNFLKEFVDSHFTSRVHVSHSNEAYDMLITWISSQPYAHRASSFLASVGARRRGFANSHPDGSQKKPLQYSPWNGSFSFWYKNHWLIFRSVQNENRFQPKEEISISCIGRSPKILMDLFGECRIEYLKLVEKRTSVFKHPYGSWQKTKTMDIRQLDTIIFDEQKKTALLNDIKMFLDPASRAWYSRCGIPYRKGYLFYGPPGTGKSSLSLSIAGDCDLDVYILNLSSVDDSSLDELFTELPARCVILLEDIDAVDATQSRQHRAVRIRQNETRSSTEGKPGGELSLSALLNVLDGVGSQEGRILIMTTNHVERLDAALIRAGRVDMKVELGLANRDINARLFSTMFLLDNAPDVGKGTEDKILVEKLATEFAAMVPEQEFSPADIQLFLLEHRGSPHMAVQNVQGWMARIREERGQIARAEPEGFGGGIPTSPPDILTTLDDVQVEEIESAVAATRPPTIPFTHCCSCQALQDIKSNPNIKPYHRSDLDHLMLGHLKLLLGIVKEIPERTTERVDAQPAAPPSSPSLSAVDACKGRFLSVKPTLGDLEHDTKSVEEQLLGLDAMKLRFLDVATAVDISASYEDACSDTSANDASSGTSFELDSEPSLETGDKEWPGKIARGCSSWPHPQLATPPDSPSSSPPITLSDEQEGEHDVYSLSLLFSQS